MNDADPGQSASGVARIDGRSFAAAQAFTLATKVFWTERIYPRLREQHAAMPSAATARTAVDVATTLRDDPLACYFAWFERHLQRFKYSGRYGLQAWHAQDRAALLASLDAGERDGASALLDLPAAFAQPDYYTGCDIHQHPGGVWSDPVAGFVYERGARSTTPLAGTRHRDLHDRFTDLAASLCPSPAAILDMGCGFGKSTRPFIERFVAARIEAVDLAAPCLRVGARDAFVAGARNVMFRQRDARNTGFADGAFDLVTSTMLLHELPPEAIVAMFREARRVLAPGGWMVHLDFLAWVQPGADAFTRYVHHGHGRRNNEPFMQPLDEMDLARVLAAAGFEAVRIEAFEEADGTLAPGYRKWRFPWAVIAGRRVG